MRSHAAALAWELQRRHRWGLTAALGYLLFLVIFKILVLKPGAVFDDEQSFALAVILPVCSTFMYFLGVFSFGLSGDLTARESIYPARLFTLPVTNAALAGWPMLYGSLAMTTLWLLARSLAVWPYGFDVPWIWPAFLAAGFLAWTQALIWMPYPLPGLRVIVVLMWLPVLDAFVIVALHFSVPESLLVAILAPQIPLAHLCARFALARARRGEVPDWRGAFMRLGRLVDVWPRRLDRFPSPSSAQMWLEWRQHGRRLPVLVAVLLPFELSMLFLFHETPAIVFETLVAVLLTPPFLAVFVAAAAGKPSSDAANPYRLTSFIATRPATDVSLIHAKLKASIWSTLVTWILLIVAMLLALRLSDTWALVIGWIQDLRGAIGAPRAAVAIVLALLTLLASTWKQLVQSLCIGLSGREWAIKGSAFMALVIAAIIVPVTQWIFNNNRVEVIIWNWVPWIFTLLVCIKLSAAAWIAIHLYDSRLVCGRKLIQGGAVWTSTVFALYGLLVWFFSVRFYLFAIISILAIPLARLSAAPLALAWNRHGKGKAILRAAGRKSVIATVLILLWLPAMVALFDAAAFCVRNRHDGTIVSSGEKREYVLHVPASYDRGRPAPLVISMHGAGGWGALQMRTSRWNALADEYGFIVVYPSAVGGAGPRVWRVQRGDGLIKDVQFISDLIDKLRATYHIDPSRIYANGLSNGGGMSFVLACTLSDRIAAVGMVAAAQTLPWSWCADHRPMPMISFHGMADPLIPYKGGSSWAFPTRWPAASTWAADWAGRNRCKSGPLESWLTKDVTLLEYRECLGNANVRLYSIQGGGHTWPGGEPLPEWFAGTTNQEIDATRLMWDFFREHPLQKPQEASGWDRRGALAPGHSVLQ